MKSGRRPTPSAGWGAGRPLLLFLVLAGLFGMHALTTHGLTCDSTTGGSHQGTHAAPHNTQPTPGAEPATTLATGAAVVALAVGDLADAPGSGAGGSVQCGVLGLCLSVLAIALLLLTGRRRGRTRILDVRSHAAPTRVARGRQHRPAPSLTLLCVNRC